MNILLLRTVSFFELSLAQFCLRFLWLLALLPQVATAGDTGLGYAPIRSKAPQSLLLDLVQAGDRLLAVGERGHIVYSDDQGAHWSQARVPTTQMLTAVFFISPQKGWATGHDGLILVTEDAGNSWRLQRDGLAVQQQINLESRERAHSQVERLAERVGELEQALSSMANGSMREDYEAKLEQASQQLDDATMDLEDAELDLLEGTAAPPLMDIWFLDADTGWAVGAFGTLVYTDNGGQHWHTQRSAIDNESEFHYYGITGDQQGRIFIAGEAGGLYRSLDRGHSWHTLQSPYSGSWFGVVHNVSPDYLVVFGLRGNVYRSTDFGTTWSPSENANTMSLAGGTVAPDGEFLLVGSVGTVLHSDDQGRSFMPQIQPDRLSLSAVLATESGRYFIVGQGGVRPLLLQ